MSIAEMRRYTALVRQGRTSLARQRELLAAHRERVAESIAAWQAALDLIDHKLDFYADWIRTGLRPASEGKGARRTAPPALTSGRKARAPAVSR
jgi:hypothetical protein